MTADEIRKILADYFWPRTPPARAPSESEWKALGTALGWSWPDDFFTFHQVVVGFSFEARFIIVRSVGLLAP